MDEATVKLYQRRYFICVSKERAFGNTRSGTVSDVINYYKFELTISFRMSSNASEVVVLGHSVIEKLEMYAHSEWNSHQFFFCHTRIWQNHIIFLVMQKTQNH